MLIDLADPAGPYAKIKVGVEDPGSELGDEKLQLNFEGDGTLIEVYSDPEMTQRIYSGHTWDIGTMETVYVKALAPGSTELVLTLENPISGERPLSDVVVININA